MSAGARFANYGDTLYSAAPWLAATRRQGDHAFTAHELSSAAFASWQLAMPKATPETSLAAQSAWLRYEQALAMTRLGRRRRDLAVVGDALALREGVVVLDMLH